MIIQSNKQLTSFIANIQVSFVQLYNNMDFMVKSHQIPSFGSITKAKCRNQVRQVVEEYLEWFIQVTTKEDLEVNMNNMHKYIGGPVQINIMMLRKFRLIPNQCTQLPWRLESGFSLIPSHSLGKSLHSTNLGTI